MSKDRFIVGPGFHFFIFSGVPYIPVALFFASQRWLEGTRYDKGYPYYLLGIVIVSFVIAMAVYERIPKRLVIPLGVVGWICTFMLFCWSLWFGPGGPFQDLKLPFLP